MSNARKPDIARVKKLLIEATGKDQPFSRRSLSLAASEGRNPDLVRNIISGSSRNPTMETLRGLADVLGIDVSSFFAEQTPASSTVGVAWITVTGKVEAGAWKSHTDWGDEDRFDVPVEQSPYPEAQRFGLVVEGFSMDLEFKPGTVLDCLRVGSGDVKPMVGDYVIVERHQNELRETTCKRLSRAKDGTFQLLCESSRPEFQDPIPVGAPDREFYGDDGVYIIGVVIGSYKRFFRRR